MHDYFFGSSIELLLPSARSEQVSTTYKKNIANHKMMPTLSSINLTVFDSRKLTNTSPLFRNIRSFMGAEFSNRVTRILAMIFVARALSPEMFGIAATILITHELTKILTANGIGQMIIASDDNNLESVCHRAHQLNFLACFSAAFIQCAAGAMLALWLNNISIFYMSICLSLVFAGMPFGLVRIFRAARRNDLHVMARINHRQITADNFLTLALAIAGFGAWAMVLPKALTMPIWLIGARASDSWVPNSKIKSVPIESFSTYCRPFLLTEALKAGRIHLDKAIVGSILGIEALGIYFFAINAGLGFATTFSRLMADCLMPHICTAVRDGKDAIAAWKKITPLLMGAGTALFTFQAAMAPFYVPLVFGSQWADYGIIVALLCLAATPRLLSDCTSQLARTTKNTSPETVSTAFITATSICILTISTLIGGLLGAAIALPLAAWLFEPAAAFWLYKTIRKGHSS